MAVTTGQVAGPSKGSGRQPNMMASGEAQAMMEGRRTVDTKVKSSRLIPPEQLIADMKDQRPK